MIGGVELRKSRNLGQIVGDSFTIYGATWRILAAVVIPIVVTALAFELILYAVNDDISKAAYNSQELQDRIDAQGDNYQPDVSPISVLAIVLIIPIGAAVYVLSSAGGVAYLSRTDLGESLTSAEALDDAQSRFGALIGSTVRALAICIGLACTIVGIPFAVIRGIRWLFISQVIMIEGLSGPGVLARSADLVRNQWWVTLGRMIVTGLVIQIPVAIVTSIVAAAAPGVISILVGVCAAFITTPYAIIATTLIFFDYQVRKAPKPNDSFSLA